MQTKICLIRIYLICHSFTYKGDSCIQNFHLRRYIVGYMVGNFVLRRCVSGAIKCNIRPYIYPDDDIPSHMNILNMVIPILMHFFHIYSSNASYFAPNVSFASSVKPLRQPITSDVTYDVDAPKVYRRIYKRKFLTLSNQTSCYIRKCIRILYRKTLE